MSKTFMPVLIWLLLFIQAAVAQADGLQPVAEQDGVLEYRLDNGLRVILAEDQAANTLFFDMVYLTGSLADPSGKGGTAHLLEHLMYKGTAQRSGEQLISGLHQRGIRFNATTSHDRTRYSAVLDAEPAHLDYLLELEAERMAGLAFDQVALQAELEVVLREMELAQANPFAALGQHMLAAATVGQGYGRPVLGSRAELGNITLADLQAFHATYYQPDNAVIVLAGKFDTSRALEVVQRHFAGMAPPSSEPRSAAMSVVMPDKPVSVDLTQGDMDMVTLAYPLPPALDQSNVALMVLADIFAGEPHGRLYQALVVPGEAAGVVALQQNFRHGGYFMFSAPLAEGQSRQQVQQLLIEQIESLAGRPVSKEELQRVQTANRQAKQRLLREPGTLIHLLAESVALGDWGLLLRRQDQLLALDVDTVQREAQAWLLAQRRLVGHLHAGGEPAGAAASLPTAVSSNTGGQSGVATPVVDAVDIAAFNQHILSVEQGIQRSRLDNGLKLALRPLPGSAGPVEGIMTLRFGDARSLFGKAALADLTGTLLVRGTQNLGHQQVVDRANQLGAGFSIVPGGSALTVRFASPAENLPALLELMAEVLRRPALARQDFDLIKRQQLLTYGRADNRPGSVASLQLRRYEEDYPVGDIRRHIEREERQAALKAIGHQDVIDFHAAFYGASQGEFALAGDFDPQQVHSQLEVLFGDWQTQHPSTRSSKPFADIAPSRMHVKAGAGRTGHYIGRLNFAANSQSEDTAALFIAEHVLGRHPTASRLGKRLREEEGLSYEIRSSLKVATFDDASWLTIQGSYPRGQGMRLADIVREEVARLVADGITQQELEQARNTILNERRQSFGQDRNILSWLPRQLYEDSTMQSWVERNNAFAAVTLEQVNRVVGKYFDAAKMVEILADGDGQ